MKRNICLLLVLTVCSFFMQRLNAQELKKVLHEDRYENSMVYSEGVAAVKVKGKWGFVDEKERYVVKPRYDSVGYMFEGMAAVKTNGKWGFINNKGKMLLKPQYDHALGFSIEGLALVGNKNVDGDMRYFFIDKTGKVVIDNTFVSGTYGIASNGYKYFSDGLRSFSKKVGALTLNGFLDVTGKTVIDAQYVDANSFREGLAAVKVRKTGKWGFIDKQGKMVVEPRFDNVLTNFHKGEAVVIEYRLEKTVEWEEQDNGNLESGERYSIVPDIYVIDRTGERVQSKTKISLGIETEYVDEIFQEWIVGDEETEEYRPQLRVDMMNLYKGKICEIVYPDGDSVLIYLE